MDIFLPGQVARGIPTAVKTAVKILRKNIRKGKMAYLMITRDSIEEMLKQAGEPMFNHSDYKLFLKVCFEERLIELHRQGAGRQGSIYRVPEGKLLASLKLTAADIERKQTGILELASKRKSKPTTETTSAPPSEPTLTADQPVAIAPATATIADEVRAAEETQTNLLQVHEEANDAAAQPQIPSAQTSGYNSEKISSTTRYTIMSRLDDLNLCPDLVANAFSTLDFKDSKALMKSIESLTTADLTTLAWSGKTHMVLNLGTGNGHPNFNLVIRIKQRKYYLESIGSRSRSPSMKRNLRMILGILALFAPAIPVVADDGVQPIIDEILLEELQPVEALATEVQPFKALDAEVQGVNTTTPKLTSIEDGLSDATVASKKPLDLSLIDYSSMLPDIEDNETTASQTNEAVEVNLTRDEQPYDVKSGFNAWMERQKLSAK